MNWRKAARVIAGLVLILLGLLWILQGAALVRMRPVLCAADCEAITGGSVGWIVAGVVALLIGLAVAGARRRKVLR